MWQWYQGAKDDSTLPVEVRGESVVAPPPLEPGPVATGG